MGLHKHYHIPVAMLQLLKEAPAFAGVAKAIHIHY
jgi:hypothetical protein